MELEQYSNNLALFGGISNLVQRYSANWSQTRCRKKISLSSLYESRKRGATVNKYELIEFITVCAALEATGDPDSALTLHSQFKLLSLSYLRYCSLTEYTVKDVLYSHRKYYTSTTSACTEFSPGPGGRGAKEGGGRFRGTVLFVWPTFSGILKKRLSNTD